MDNIFMRSAVKNTEVNEVNTIDSINCIWDELVMPGEIITPGLTADIFPDWVSDYVIALSKSTQTPLGMSVMMALSVLATCVQKRYEVSPYKDDYTEPLSIWTLIAMPPASRKTAVVNALSQPLLEWEQEQSDLMKDQIIEVETKIAVNQKAIDRLQAKAAKEQDHNEKLILIRDINDLKKDTPNELLPPRLWTADVTPERLQSLIAENKERIGLISDEGGIFEIMAGLYSGGKANIDVFLQSHAGKGTRVDRGGRTVHLNKPALSFGLAVQPEVLKGFSSKGKNHFRGLGALARFLYCIPPSNIGSRDVKKRISISPYIKKRYRDGIFELLNIQPVLDANGNEVPRTIQLNSEALDIWEQFSQSIEFRQGSGSEFELIQDWTGKLPGAALRIAGICHVARNINDSENIEKAEMMTVLKFSDLLISHAQQAFDLMDTDQAIADAKVILNWVIKNGQLFFKRSNCQRSHRGRFPKIDRLLKALEILQSWNVISEVELVKAKDSGRPSPTYHVNPDLITYKEQ
jgi:hypothetical protein